MRTTSSLLEYSNRDEGLECLQHRFERQTAFDGNMLPLVRFPSRMYGHGSTRSPACRNGRSMSGSRLPARRAGARYVESTKDACIENFFLRAIGRG